MSHNFNQYVITWCIASTDVEICLILITTELLKIHSLSHGLISLTAYKTWQDFLYISGTGSRNTRTCILIDKWCLFMIASWNGMPPSLYFITLSQEYKYFIILHSQWIVHLEILNHNYHHTIHKPGLILSGLWSQFNAELWPLRRGGASCGNLLLKLPYFHWRKYI